VVKPPPKITNKFQTWYLLLGIALITVLNLAMTSLLTKQSLAEMTPEPGIENVEPVYSGVPLIAALDGPVAVEIKYNPQLLRRQRAIKRVDEGRYLVRVLPPSERFVSPSKPLFQPRIIRIPPPEPPVTFSTPPRAYVAKLEYKQQPISARIVSNHRDSFLAKLVKKPWQFMKAVASKLH
jgi:hypothetical protein